MQYHHTIGRKTYRFNNLKTLLAKASPHRSGDVLAGLCAESYEERVAAQITLADVPLKVFLNEAIIPYEKDEITRLIIDSHDNKAFKLIDSLTVGEFRDWLLKEETNALTLQKLAPGITPEMAAAVSKLMRNQDLIAVAKKCEVITSFRDTIGL
ncbi:MAG: ethanolamine ammonia-lyase subunit EutB, partial [Mucilaginibacter sp.]|nr:ethanolamine ammonia-lyase subunit EutB [Mucilaginibacter sp.]